MSGLLAFLASVHRTPRKNLGIFTPCPACWLSADTEGPFFGKKITKDFVKMRDYISRQKACAYNEHFNSSVNMAMSMFKLSTTSRWALIAARGWARLILDRRRDMINAGHALWPDASAVPPRAAADEQKSFGRGPKRRGQVVLTVRPLLTELDGPHHHHPTKGEGVGFTSRNGNAAPELAMWNGPKAECSTGAENDQ